MFFNPAYSFFYFCRKLNCYHNLCYFNFILFYYFLTNITILLINYRQTFLVSKVIDNLQDEAYEEYVQSGKKTNIMIANTDYDWDDPEGEEHSL